MIFSEFLSKQERIYGEFRDVSKVELEGLEPKIADNKGAYIIALRHSQNIIAGVDNFTKKISEITSLIKYDESNMHTTLATYGEVDGFQPSNETLAILANNLRNNIPLMKGIEIEYKEWLINQDSGIAAGIPNAVFFQGARRIIEETKDDGINLKAPWGSHITVSRFLEKTSHEQTLELLEIFKNAQPLGISKPKYIDVGYFILTPESFKINIYERFEI